MTLSSVTSVIELYSYSCFELHLVQHLLSELFAFFIILNTGNTAINMGKLPSRYAVLLLPIYQFLFFHVILA